MQSEQNDGKGGSVAYNEAISGGKLGRWTDWYLYDYVSPNLPTTNKI